MTLRLRFRRCSALLLGTAALLALATLPATAQESGYSYIRTLDGSATVIQGDTQDREPAEINQPILPGDQLLVARGSRVELVLSDRTLLHVDGSSEIAFVQLAESPDSEARATVLRLLDGEIRVETDDFPSASRGGAEPPQIETGNATAYLGEHGSFRLVSEQDDWSELTVREGSAEVATERGSSIVREGESAEIEGVSRARIAIHPAAGRDALERWAENLLDQGDAYRDQYVDDDLRYSSQPLSGYGSWTTVDRRAVWRPRVSAGWRPYSQGRWRNSPGGAIWISSEPWGWVPYHYGTWDYFPSIGWAWVPGRVFAPAWVYWYWGPSYVGWCPVGYYTRYYGGSGFRDGLYGWAHGSGSFFAEWNFVPFRNFGDRDLGHRVRRGRDLGVALERGLVTTDTRPLGRERWNDPTRAIEILRRGRPDLPDVSDFVARKRDLPPTVRREIAIERPDGRLDGTPLRPGTLGGGADGSAPGTRTADTPRGRTRLNPRGGEVDGQPARDNGRPTDPRPGTGVENGRDSGRSGLDTRERPSRDSGDAGSNPGNDRGTSVDRRRPVTPDPGPTTGQPAPVERERPIYQRPTRDDSGDSGGNTREARPEPARERPVERDQPVERERPVERQQPVERERPVERQQPVERERPVERQQPVERERPVERDRPSYEPPARQAEPPPSASRRDEPARDEPSASRREEPSSPPPQEARPRERQDPDSGAERSAAPSRREGRDRPRGSNDDGNDGSPPPRG